MRKLKFDNRSLERLPVEDSGDYLIQRPIPDACFSLVKPTPVSTPKVVVWSQRALDLIGVEGEETDEFAELFSGNKEIDGAKYAAHCYCGHQFGNFAGQLGFLKQLLKQFTASCQFKVYSGTREQFRMYNNCPWNSGPECT